MPDGYKLYRGRAYPDPRGFRIDPTRWWDDDPLLDDKPWHPALFWKWLIQLAEWDRDGRVVRTKSGPVRVERGQVYHALRFLGHRPGWKKDRVRGELRRLEQEGRIELELVAGQTRITIVNYDPYQDLTWYLQTASEIPEPHSRQTSRQTSRQGQVRMAAGVRAKSGPADRQQRRQTSRQRHDSDTTDLKRGYYPSSLPPLPSPSLPLPRTRAREADRPQTDSPTSWRDLRAAKLAQIWPAIPMSARVPMLMEAVASGPPPGDLADWAREQCELAGVPIPETPEDALRRKLAALRGEEE